MRSYNNEYEDEIRKLNIAIVGMGFVGKAVKYGFTTPSVNLIEIDPKQYTHISDLKGLDLYATFVCAPTPMNDDGSINASIVEEVIKFLEKNTVGLIILKSTVTPDIINKFKDNSRFIYNPEFLTEANYKTDFVNPEFHVFGGSRKNCDLLDLLYFNHSIVNKNVEIFKVTAKEASYIKYGINSFLASKVLWFNQFYDLILGDPDVSYTTVRSIIGHDKRIGYSHTKVPGPDGKQGFSGACFPKDTLAFLRFGEQCGIDLSVLREVINQNQAYRLKYELTDREKEQHISFDKSI